MEKKRYNIYLPPIRDDESGYTYLSRISDAILSNPQHDYVFDFSKCSTISHTGLVVIGGIRNYLTQYDKKTSLGKAFGLLSLIPSRKVGFKINHITIPLMDKLQNLGFWNYVQSDYGINKSDNYIGYREHEAVIEDSEIINHLRDSWLTSEKLSMSESLKSEIVSSIYEIFVNAYGHGLKDNLNNLSVISCGDYDKKNKKLSLSVLDYGGGIIQRVQKQENLLDKKEAFEWALEVGNSTRTDSGSIPRGLGFGILKEFVKLNDGVLRICSGNYMATAGKDGKYVVEKIPGYFIGTLVSITIKCDKKHYKLKAESTDNLPTYF